MRAHVAFVLLLSSPVLAGATVTESDAIRLFLGSSPRARIVPLVRQSVSAEVRDVARAPNPSIAYQVEDSGGTRDEFLTVEQELPITGRRGLVRDGAETAARAAGLAEERKLQLDIHSLRTSFHDIVFHERSRVALERGAERVEHLVQILRVREAEGEGSGYDMLRAEQELAELAIRASETAAELGSARSRFGSFFESELAMGAASLEGDLEPGGPIPETEAAVAQAVAGRADLQSLIAEGERHALAEKAARRGRFPEPVLTAGWKKTETLGLDDTGFVAGLSVPLPIFDRAQVGIARATAAGQRVELEAEMLRREIRAEVLSAISRERAAREAAMRYGEDVGRRAEELRTIAQLRYDEGESGILELLDAYRTAVAMELRSLAAAHEAKRAEIDRDRAIGYEVTP